MKYTIIFIASLLFLSGCTKSEEVSVHKSYKTFLVGDGNLAVTDTIIVPVEGKLTSDLSFKTSGRIGEIFVRPGDIVKKGQILARLTNQEGLITYDGLGNVIENIGAIERSTTTMRNNTVEMRNATSRLYDERISQAETGIKNLEITLEQAKKNLTNKTSTLNTNYHLHMNAFTKFSDSVLYESDKILGITTNFEHSNDGWEPYLGARIGNIKVTAENDWGKLYEARGRILAKKDIVITPENAEVEIAELKESFNVLNNMTIAMSTMLENSVVGADLNEDRLNGWISAWNTFKANEQSIESQFSQWKDNAVSLVQTASGGSSVASMDLNNLSLQIENAKKNIDVLKAEKETKLREIGVNISQIDGKSSELGLQRSQTVMNQFLSQEAIDGTIIYSPFDGVILEKFFDVGNMTQAGVPIFRITSKDTPTIKTYIDNYTYNYKKGDTITLTNNYNKEAFTGSISLVQAEKDPLHNKNYAEISIIGYSGSLGERMEVRLSHKEKALENGVIIPLSSIITRYGPPGVFVLEGSGAHYQPIEILASDMSYAEVLGIAKKSIIITDGKENMIDGEILQN